MIRHEMVVVGAGPAGLSAAIEASSHGVEAVVFDENQKPGGQLFKQIHKFFGSKEHRARERGFKIGEDLLNEARDNGVRVELNAVVNGIFEGKELTVIKDNKALHIRSNNLVIATGASENMVPFEGWTLPGVIGAGAAQTMVNLHGILPGENVLMVGSGNVGVVVGLQLIQAGCKLTAVIDASPRVGGYGVHAAKIARTGVPFHLSHTVKKAYGNDRVEGVTIVQVDDKWQPIPGSEKDLKVDTICMAVGLTPMSQLTRIAGCSMVDDPGRGGMVPCIDEYGQTTIPGLYAAGDVSGIEEASSAMIEGRISGLSIAYKNGYIQKETFLKRYTELKASLEQLRGGQFGHGKKGSVQTKSEEGYTLSETLVSKGYVADTEISHFPGVPSEERRKKGVVAVVECTQNIPCNPCQMVCPKGGIKVGNNINSLPMVDEDFECTGCSLCVANCPGQAVFLVDETYEPGFAAVTLPYEFIPLPEKGEKGTALNRAGDVLGEAEVISIRKSVSMDQTAVLTIKVPVEWSMKARFFKREVEVAHG